jgi:ABC-type cobalamin/Fe3+-siderophores transport system ATPase subunit
MEKCADFLCIDVNRGAEKGGLMLAHMDTVHEKGLFGTLCAEERERIRAMADEFGVLTLLERDLAAMSAGERQMIFLLAAAVRQTPVLLLDEPSSALDFNRTEELFALSHRLAAQGRAIVIVLHDPTQAIRHATSILELDETGAERLDLTTPDYDHIEQSLRRLYPHLRIHRDPLVCLDERERVQSEDFEHDNR